VTILCRLSSFVFAERGAEDVLKPEMRAWQWWIEDLVSL
jgi:hypothetical protein